MKRRIPIGTVQPSPARTDATARVLLLDDEPSRSLRGVALDLGARLAASDLRADLDTIRRPRTALPTITENPRALQRYTAVITLAAAAPSNQLFRSATLLERASTLISQRLPTLTVFIERGPNPHERSRELQSAARTPAGSVLNLPAGIGPTAAAQDISVALTALLALSSPITTARTLQPEDVLNRRLQHIVRLTREAFDADSAEIMLFGPRSSAVVAEAGTTRHTRALVNAARSMTLNRPELAVIPDTRTHPGTRALRQDRTDDAAHSYAGIAIHDATGTVIGALCIWSREPLHIDRTDHDLLHDLALLAEGELLEAARAPLNSRR